MNNIDDRQARPPLTLAIVVPVFMEPNIGAELDCVCQQAADEIIIVDGGEALMTERLRAWMAARALANVCVITAPRGRASQMNAGAAVATADILLFLHADTELPPDAPAFIRGAIDTGAVWGRFDVRLSGARPAFRVIEYFMNMRSAITGIATGDQCIFVRREVFQWLGGFRPIEIMEDIDLSGRLKSVGPPFRIRPCVVTSSRRWERQGILRTVVLMWFLRAMYALGASPRFLSQWYK